MLVDLDLFNPPIVKLADGVLKPVLGGTKHLLTLNGALVEPLNPLHEVGSQRDNPVLFHDFVPDIIQSLLPKGVLEQVTYHFFG